MDGWKDGWRMDGASKKIKIGIIFYMPKKIMKAKGEKYIQKKVKIICGFIFWLT
jgi:hypothetical protein